MEYMRRNYFTILIVVIAIGGIGLFGNQQTLVSGMADGVDLNWMNDQPQSLSFIPNRGQFEKSVLFVVKTAGYRMWIRSDRLVFDTLDQTSRKRSVVDMRFLNRSSNLQVRTGRKSRERLNYFKGRDAEKWIRNVPMFKEVLFSNLYKGIDLKIYGTADGKIEYDWVIHPGASLDDVRLQISGADKIDVDNSGILRIRHPFGTYRHSIPLAFQTIDGKMESVTAGFRIDSDGRVGIRAGNFNPDHPLTIDPVIEMKYSSYFGGRNYDSVKAVKVDSSGNLYVTGITASANFPTTTGAYDVSIGDGEYDIFITKMSNTGKTLAYSTFIGGCCRDYASDIAIDSTGNAYITGYTESEDFPVSSGAYQTVYAGGKTDAFVLKLDTDGDALEFSTYLGGCNEDYGMGIATDSDASFCTDNDGNAYVTGYTDCTDFPVSETTYQSTNKGLIDSFIVKLSDDGSSLTYSTYIGGTLNDYAVAITVDCCGEATVAGNTGSVDFPTASAHQAALAGETDGFITRISTTGDSVVFSTYLGGKGVENVTDLATCMNCCGYTYISGDTNSLDFPLLLPFQNIFGGGYSDGFITMLTKSGTMSYSTYFGGVGRDSISQVALDSSRNIFVAGSTDSNNLPVLNGYQNHLINLKNDLFVSMLSQSGSRLLFSSYLGGGGHDILNGLSIGCCGGVYLGGETESGDFPVSNGYFNKYRGGSKDGFLTKFHFLPDDIVTIVYPNGGESLEKGNTYSITWESSALNREVILELYHDGMFHSTIGMANTGALTYSWQIPPSLVPGDKYQIRIYSGEVEDFSDINFSIVDTTPAISIQGNRKKEYFWIVEKEYAELKIQVENAFSALIAKYHIYRKESNGNYAVIKKLTKSELESGNFIYNDKYIEKNKNYKYKVIALDLNNREVGVSNEISI